jgi:hypothetical protein
MLQLAYAEFRIRDSRFGLAVLGLGILGPFEGTALPRILAVSGAAAFAHALAAPSWAKVLPYWQFCALPFVVLSLLLVGRMRWARARARRSVLVGVLVVAMKL